ncbi:hypothetical protein B296_00016761 [Ensete ventricosum]|uniref:Uncharacterized protein n=1 Tax=Ensete ventricosum TaxID=4639 RepID=A0A426YF10_ENSVE|nr:hypothetical protein B296_00016761 [Ensete ventricosum]
MDSFYLFQQILDNGCAYKIDGDVYFSVDKFPAYGRLSGRKLEDNRAGERVAVDSRKQNPADFALWKVRYFYFWLCLKSLWYMNKSYLLPRRLCKQVLKQLRERALRRVGLTEDELLLKIEERTTARKNKQYDKSDEIRRGLAAIGITLMDSHTGTTWKPTVPHDVHEHANAM